MIFLVCEKPPIDQIESGKRGFGKQLREWFSYSRAAEICNMHKERPSHLKKGYFSVIMRGF